ncbi:hypothetical protein EV421DRAFT_607676 [Armillaria borealis]|uniref:RBR-type E3 ubiquitin transferase n=1 Tax=Armillaria borealis TaxID=47425 RepID=A0AA39MP19_9AGAR|nr:hypothetical protein EV421DRAFT_607676 [Armillaria borealis]
MQIYRRSEAVSVLRCPSCFSEICSSCGEDSHGRMSCEYARIHNNPVEQERMSEIWLLQRRGIKKCPTCSRFLEKTEGCNHMMCPCGAHICWRCMGVFDATNIYDHMGTVHGSIDADEPEPPLVAPGQYDQNRFEQDRIALYHAEAMEQRRREEADRVAQERRDQIKREQDRIAAQHVEAIERRKREEEQERQREERAAEWRRQQAEWQ